MISVARVFFTILKIFLLIVVTAMVRFQIPELRYDLGSKEPVSIESPGQLKQETSGHSTFASVKGKPDFTRAATFAKHGVQFTYFLLEGYDTKLVVRTSEPVTEEWTDIEFHLGRLRPYQRMPFSRSVRAGFRKNFDIGIPDGAFFLARDDVPKPSGWSIGATIFAGILWCVLFYFFFVHGLIFKTRAVTLLVSGNSASAHQAQPEPPGNQPGNDGSDCD
jgi:hypothetical protein